MNRGKLKRIKRMKHKEYLIKFRYINTGTATHSIFTVEEDDNRPIETIIREKWGGLLCELGGLRSIVEITELSIDIPKDNSCCNNDCGCS